MDEVFANCETRRKGELLRTSISPEPVEEPREIIERFPSIHHDIKTTRSVGSAVWKLQNLQRYFFRCRARGWLDGTQEVLRRTTTWFAIRSGNVSAANTGAYASQILLAVRLAS